MPLDTITLVHSHTYLHMDCIQLTFFSFTGELISLFIFSTGAAVGTNSFLALAIKPASRSTSLGSASLPSNHSSAVRAGSSLKQGGKMSD